MAKQAGLINCLQPGLEQLSWSLQALAGPGAAALVTFPPSIKTDSTNGWVLAPALSLCCACPINGKKLLLLLKGCCRHS